MNLILGVMAGALCGHETADQAQDALDKYAKNRKMRAL